MPERRIPLYIVPEEVLKQINNSYTYHPPQDGQPARYEYLRNFAKEFAIAICENAPHSRERAIALTDLEKVVTMVNKAIACNE